MTVTKKIGEVLLQTLDYHELVRLTGTLEGVNRENRETGRPEFTPGVTIREAYAVLESDRLRRASKEARVNVFADKRVAKQIRDRGCNPEGAKETLLHLLGTGYAYDVRFSLELEDKYPGLKARVNFIKENSDKF